MPVAGCSSCTCQYVFLFSDCSKLTSEGLLHFGKLPSLHTLRLGRMNAGLINGRWISVLSPGMRELIITGELQWHTPAVNVMERQRIWGFGNAIQIYSYLFEADGDN